jgi:hypothetical protein
LESLFIEATNKEKAAQKALKQLSDQMDLTINDLLVEEEKNVFSMLKSKKKYRVSIQKQKKLNISLLKDVFEINKLLNLEFSEVVEYNFSDYEERIDGNNNNNNYDEFYNLNKKSKEILRIGNLINKFFQ